jgi:hypothetical protein
MSWALDARERLRTVHIPHRNYEAARTDLRSALAFSEEGELLRVVGPTGVGKSRLRKQVVPLISDPSVQADDMFMPVVTTSAINSNTNGSFSTRQFAIAALKSIEHPIYAPSSKKPFDVGRIRITARTGEPELRDAFLEALQWRKTKLWVVDELQELMKIRGGAECASNYLDSVKCLGAESGIRIMVFTTYKLLEALQMSTHLVRRTMDTHFRRYRPDVKEDVIAFDQILSVYSEMLRFDGSTSLRDWNEYLYAGSLGCIGLLQSWIRNALRVVVASKSKTLRLPHFEAQRRADIELQGIELEIRAGEEMLANTGLLPSELDHIPPLMKRRVSRPFRRKPKRDPVGGGGIRG